MDLKILEERTQEINSFHSSLSHPFNWRRRQKREFNNENKQLSLRFNSFLLRQSNNWTIFFALYFSAVLLLLLCWMLILEFDCLKQSGYFDIVTIAFASEWMLCWAKTRMKKNANWKQAKNCVCTQINYRM